MRLDHWCAPTSQPSFHPSRGSSMRSKHKAASTSRQQHAKQARGSSMRSQHEAVKHKAVKQAQAQGMRSKHKAVSDQRLRWALKPATPPVTTAAVTSFSSARLHLHAQPACAYICLHAQRARSSRGKTQTWRVHTCNRCNRCNRCNAEWASQRALRRCRSPLPSAQRRIRGGERTRHRRVRCGIPQGLARKC
jgi:hypothetical protein